MTFELTPEDLDTIDDLLQAIDPAAPVAMQLAQLEEEALSNLAWKAMDPARMPRTAGQVARLIMLGHGLEVGMADKLGDGFEIMLIGHIAELKTRSVF
jgi:hypothetical protein